MSIGIYKIISPSGKIYIGQSIEIENRWKYYKKIHYKKTKLYKSFQKYGYINHKFEIIEECSLELLNEREIFWKKYYLEQFNNSWNMVLFHELYDRGGGPKSESTKLKLSLKSKGKSKPIGFGESISKPVLQYDLEGNFIKEWPSITEAKKYYNGDIQACLLLKQKTASNYIWNYKIDNYPLKITLDLINGNKNKSKNQNWIKSKYKRIIQYDLDGNFIKEWESIKQITETLNIQQSGISNCCLGKTKTSNKFIWKYK
jgi:group I intron endonuclease